MKVKNVRFAKENTLRMAVFVVKFPIKFPVLWCRGTGLENPFENENGEVF
jgi:hypothetical protein